MKFLLLLRDLSANGITTYNRQLARELGAQGQQVHAWPSDARINSLSHHPLPLLHPLLLPLARPRIEAIGPDLVLANNYTQARVAHKLCQRLAIPWFAVMHNGHSPQRMSQWARLFENVSGLVTMCDNLHGVYSDLVASQVMGPEGKTPPVLRSRLPIQAPLRCARQEGRPLCLAYCSRLSQGKAWCCEAWLRAVARLPQPSQYRLLVMGGGRCLAALKQLSLALGLRVEFTGMVSDPGPLLAQVDLLSGAGYALMEGMAHGCAAVGLGFRGCFGAISLERWAAAKAVNFGDHSEQEFPHDPDWIASQLQMALRLLCSGEASQVAALATQDFAPAPIVREMLVFFKQAMPSRSAQLARAPSWLAH